MFIHFDKMKSIALTPSFNAFSRKTFGALCAFVTAIPVYAATVVPPNEQLVLREIQMSLH
jgi:hypothetical protein